MMGNQLPVGRFIDPLSDFGFKFLFGSEPNKDILIDLLNELFQGQKKINDLVYSPTERAGDRKELKKVFFDLFCTGEHGEKFIVEMQRAEQVFFKERAVFYTSRAIHEQLPKGKESWDYPLKEVYLIALLEFELDDTPPGQYLNSIGLINKETCKVFYDKLEYKFIEIPKFVKTEDQLVTDLDRWLYLLKNLHRLKKIPVFLKKKVFQKIFKIAEIGQLSKEERMAYDASLKAKWDYDNTMKFAVEKAAKEADKKARKEERSKLAQEMKKDGLPLSQITKLTKLSKKEIEALK